MKRYRIITYLCILLGGGFVIYANPKALQNPYYLIAGFVLLMIGLYRVSKGIPNKTDHSETTDTDEA